jgi:hypothetical protein
VIFVSCRAAVPVPDTIYQVIGMCFGMSSD